MEKLSPSIEEKLRDDMNGEFHREIADQLTSIAFRLADEKRKLHERSVYEKVVAADNAIKSAIAVIQLFEASRKHSPGRTSWQH